MADEHACWIIEHRGWKTAIGERELGKEILIRLAELEILLEPGDGVTDGAGAVGRGGQRAT